MSSSTGSACGTGTEQIQNNNSRFRDMTHCYQNDPITGCHQSEDISGPQYVLIRITSDKVLECRNTLNKYRAVIENYGGKVVGLGEKVLFLEENLRKWRHNHSIVLLWFETRDQTLLWWQSMPDVKQQDWLGDSVDVVIIPARTQASAAPHILIAEPHFYANSLPWHNVQFWYARTKLAPYLSDSVTITPQSATLYAVAVEFKDLWKIRAPVGDCEGFDLRSFDELILSASNEVDDKEEPHPLWEYPSSPLTKPVPLIKFDFTQPLIGMKTVQRQGIINFCSSGTCNGVALWMDFHVDSHNCVSTGPTKPLKSGETIQWDMNSRQGVHLLQNQHTVEPGVGLDAQKFKYGVSFMPKTGDFEFKFAVG